MSALSVQSLQLDHDDPGLRLAGSRLTCEPVTSWPALRRVQDEWDRLAETQSLPMTLRPAWCQAWWEELRGDAELRSFLFWDGNDLIGVAPIVVDWVRLGPVRLRVAKFMGADLAPGPITLPVRADWAEVAADELVQRLVRDARCDALHFRGLDARSAGAEALRVSAHERRDLVRVERDAIVGVTTRLELPDTIAAFRDRLSAGRRARHRRTWRTLERMAGWTHATTVCEPAATLPAFHELIQLHESQWRWSRGHFGRHTGAVRLQSRLIELMGARDGAALVGVRAGDRTVAWRSALVGGNSAAAWFAARERGAPWDRHALGEVALTALLEHLVERRVERVDLGFGGCETEHALGATPLPVRSLLLVARATARRTDRQLFCAGLTALDHAFGKGRVPPRWLRPSWSRTRLGV